MKKIYKPLVIVSLMCMLCVIITGCKEEEVKPEQKVEGNYKIYYPNKDYTKILSDSIEIDKRDAEEVVNELIIKLKQGKYANSNTAVIPQNIEYATYTQEADILTLTFDENYLKLSGIEEVLKRASIVYTMLQVDKVDYVRIQVNGQPLVIGETEVGDMSEDTFVDLIGENSEFEIKDKVKIYYTDSTGKKLRMLETDIVTDGTVMKEEVIINKLISGPKGTEKVGYHATINPETKLNRVAIQDKICYVDFDESFLERRNGVSEDVVVYSLVNTLTELSTVTQVRITINGYIVEKFADKVPLNNLIEKNYDIISYEE